MEKTLNADYLLTLAFEQVLQSGARRKREEEKGEKRERERERRWNAPTPTPFPLSLFTLSPFLLDLSGRGQIPPARRSLLTGYIDVSYHTYQMRHPTYGQKHL